MHIESVTLQNFRCFGAEPTTVTVGADVTALIGANGAGKSARGKSTRHAAKVDEEVMTVLRLSGSTTRKPVIAAAPASAAAQR